MKHYGLISSSELVYLDKRHHTIGITEAGTFYLDVLMVRLEYLQCVYWETWIDDDLAVREFPIYDIAELVPFVDKFVEFLVREESREAYRNAANPAYERFLRTTFRDHKQQSLSRRVQQVAMEQVMRIYFAERRRS